MATLLKQFERLIKFAILLVFLTMIVAVLTQVFARSFLSQPPLWTEEAARTTLLYIVGLGVGASILTGDLVNVDLALVLMPPWLRRACDALSAALISAFGFLLVPGAWEFTVSGAMQTSPVLQMPMQYIFASMLCFAILMGVFGLIRFIQVLRPSLQSEAPAGTHH